jgi:hypothetical protein
VFFKIAISPRHHTEKVAFLLRRLTNKISLLLAKGGTGSLVLIELVTQMRLSACGQSDPLQASRRRFMGARVVAT